MQGDIKYAVLKDKDGKQEHFLMYRKGRFRVACRPDVKVFKRYLEYETGDKVDLSCAECRRQFERFFTFYAQRRIQDNEE